jgi:TPR repeat protein
MKNGTVMQPDMVKALHWTTMAAQNGDRGAKHELGTAYLNGHKFGVKQDFYKAVKFLGEAAMLNHPYSLFELGVALTDQTSWLSRLGRMLESDNYVFGSPEQLEADDIEIVEGVGKLKFMILRNSWNQEFSMPLGFDCYSGRKFLQQIAHMGPWTHPEIEEAIEAYIQGDDVLSAYKWDTCSLIGVVSCSANTVFLNSLYLDTVGEAPAAAAAEDGAPAIEVVDFKKYIFDTRVALANDDDVESVGWLAECFNGDLPPEEASCEENKELAWKLFKEAAALGDEKSSYDMAVMHWRGDVPGEERNVTRSLELLDDLILRQAEGYVGAYLTRYGIVGYEFCYGWWRWYVDLVSRTLLGKKGEETGDGSASGREL